MPNSTDVVEARQKQSDESKTATLDLLKNKRRARSTFTLFLADEDGEQQELELTFQAIGARDYDKLVSKHPPKAEQRVEGASFDIDTFAPALIAKCSVEPEMTEKDAKEIWDSPDWSRGDLMVLFRQAVELNNRGLDIPFSANG
jgi:hypothetical protein